MDQAGEQALDLYQLLIAQWVHLRLDSFLAVTLIHQFILRLNDIGRREKMRLNEILNRVDLLKPGQQLSLARYKSDKLQSWIVEHCSEFLSVAGDYKLYRGIKNETRESFIGYSRENRPTVEYYSTEAAEKVDFLLKLAGWPARRSNSIFCNSFTGAARSWGEVYEIYPINGFTFGYSKAFTNCNACAYNIRPRMMNAEHVEEFLDYNELYNTNLQWPLINHYDVWIHGAYVAIKHEETKINADDFKGLPVKYNPENEEFD
jgi:hypothetical protein